MRRRVVFGKLISQGQQTYEAITFTHSAHNPPLSTDTPSMEIKNGTIQHTHQAQRAGWVYCMYNN